MNGVYGEEAAHFMEARRQKEKQEGARIPISPPMTHSPSDLTSSNYAPLPKGFTASQ
jgi:hypothetical protein